MFKSSSELYSLILMGINMPEMNDYEATQNIRSLTCKKAEDIPVIAVTANIFKEDVEHCLAVGMNDHIGKPINIDDFFAKLQKHLRT